MFGARRKMDNTITCGDLVRIKEEEEIMLVVNFWGDTGDRVAHTALCLRGGNLRYIPKDMLEAIG